MPDTSKHANDITFTEESLIGFIKKIHNNIRDNLMFASTSDMAEKAISFQKLKTQGIIGDDNKFTLDYYEYEQVPIDLTNTDYFYDQNEWEQIATPDPNSTTGEMNYYSRLKIYHIPTLFNEEQILNFYEQNPNQDLEYTIKDSPNNYYIVDTTEKYTSISDPVITYSDVSTGHSAVIHFNVDKFYVKTGSIYHSNYYKVLRNSECIDCDENTVYNENDIFILTANLTDAEKEVLQIFPAGSDNSWDVTHAAQICIINIEYPLGNINNGRYTWVRGGSLLEFKTKQTGYYANSSDTTLTDYTTENADANRPNGTIFINENNGTNIHVVQVKGFDGYGNLDNSNANPVKGTNGTAFIASDILYVYKQLGSTGYPVPQAYITNLGSSDKPVETAYIKNLSLTGNNAGINSSGAIVITNTTEAQRNNPPLVAEQNATNANNYATIEIENMSQLSGSIKTLGGISAAKHIMGKKLFGAVFNDYAEYRQTNSAAPGRCVIEVGDGNMITSTQRLQPGANIVSDTFGFAIGETTFAQTPIAVCGRVLAYPFEDKEMYKPGDAVCSGPDGTISKMTREEIKEWPDRIVGYVSEIPTYEYWGSDKVEVNGRIWIKIK